jgi:putative membrane protein
MPETPDGISPGERVHGLENAGAHGRIDGVPTGNGEATDRVDGADRVDGDRVAGVAQPDERSTEGRLHPSVIVLWTLQAFAPLAALWIASSAEQMIAVAAVGLTLLSSWVRWLRYRWRVESDQLIVEHGLIQRTRRIIPLERIQAVQTVRKIRHRVFGVVGLRIETVGGNESEGQLDALRPALAAEVQRRLLRTPEVVAQPAADAAQAGTVIARCTPQMLFVAGLTGGRVGAAAAVLAFAQEFAGERLATAAISAPERLGVTLLVVLVALGIVAAFAMSVVATALTYWDFTVRRDGDLLRLRRGLLTERQDTVPLARVQSLTVEENIVRRALGLAAVKMVVAGRAGEDEALTSTLLPIAPRAEAFALIGQVLGIDDPAQVTLHPMPPAARARRLVRAAVAVVVVTAVTWTVLEWPLGLTVALLAVPAALGAYRALGWHHGEDVVLARSGWLVRHTSVTPVDTPQSVSVSNSPFQRRRGLATLRLEIARTRGAADPRLIDMHREDAERLQHSLIARQIPAGVTPAPQ